MLCASNRRFFRDVQIEMLKQELIKETAAKEHYKGLYERQCAKTEEKVETIKERDSLMADKEKLLERAIMKPKNRPSPSGIRKRLGKLAENWKNM